MTNGETVNKANKAAYITLKLISYLEISEIRISFTAVHEFK